MSLSILGTDLSVLPTNYDGTIDSYVKDVLERESDVIVTSVIIGFICTRYYQGQPCQFDIEYPTELDSELMRFLVAGEKVQLEIIKEQDDKKVEFINSINWSDLPEFKFREYCNVISEFTIEIDKLNKMMKGPKPDIIEKQLIEWQHFLSVLSALSYVVDKQETGMGKWLTDGQSPFGKEGKLITGKKGGQMLDTKNRSTPLTYSKAQMLKNAMNSKDNIYQGRGAYTGLVDNPIEDNKKLYPTMRVDVTGYSDRSWLGKKDIAYWGLIGWKDDTSINLAPLPEGMGTIPAENPPQNLKIGYIHGMCSAIVSCVYEGPWCTPYEMATGEATTKMASCFPCATYMYSAGFSPSSIHLGRGESWVPPHDCKRLEWDNTKQKSTNINKKISENLQQNWNREIYKQMDIGLKCMVKAKKYINNGHNSIVLDLQKRLENYFNNGVSDIEKDEIRETYGGALFLDALTIHDKEISRLTRTLQPSVDIVDFMEKEILNG